MCNRTKTCLGMLFGVLLSTNAWGQNDKSYVEIAGTNVSLFRLAIPPVIDGGGAAQAARTVQDVMTNDFTLIGLFKVLDAKSFLANLVREGMGLVPQDWINVGAQGVIKARARANGGQISVEFLLYDVAKGSTPVLNRTLQGPNKAVRKLAHQFGDEVVRYYTKARGIFTTKIAFVSGGRGAQTSSVYVMDYDGYGPYKVTNNSTQNILPAWSPSGMLAYTGFLWRNPDLYLVGGGGGRATRISKYPGLNSGAAFSPKGEIALTLSKDGNSEIYVINSSGTILRRLTNNPAIDTSPTWSPDGSQIAFVSDRGGSPQIYVMSAGGGGARRLTFQGNYNQEPAWCPNPQTPLVAFTGRDEGGRYDIFTVNVKSGEMKRLTQGQGSNTSPSWAPNGLLLVFASSRGGLWLSNPEGLNQHRVFSGGASTPDWSF